MVQPDVPLRAGGRAGPGAEPGFRPRRGGAAAAPGEPQPVPAHGRVAEAVAAPAQVSWPAADPARSAAAAIHRRAHGRAAPGDAGSVRPRSGPLDHPARGREAAPGGHAQEAPVAQGHSTLHRAAVGAGHRDRPAPARTAQTGPALSVPPRQRVEEAHEREHAQRRAQAHGLSRPADRARHPGHDVHRAQRDRLPEGVGGRATLARRSQQGQCHLQPRRVRRAAAADDAGLGRPARSLRAEHGRGSEHAAHHSFGGRARPLG